MAEAERERTFEEELEAIEGIVAELERGELGLEDAIRRYEEGIGTVRRCLRILEEAEARIEILAREGERPVFRPLDPAALAEGPEPGA